MQNLEKLSIKVSNVAGKSKGKSGRKTRKASRIRSDDDIFADLVSNFVPVV